MAGEEPMGTPASRADTRLTYEDRLQLPDDGLRHEIIDGEHYVTAAPNIRHQLVVGRLHGELYGYLKTRPGTGVLLTAPTDVVLSRHDVVEPDLLFVAADQASVVTAANLQGAPALVVEVLSPSTRKRDAQIRRRLFARSGVREYWLVDPELDTVQVFRPAAPGTFVRAAELSAEDDQALTTPILPGWSLELRDLFREGA
jgi:Uma2 family endonuclease